MRREIIELRKYVKEAGMDAYYVPYGDFHCSEYASDYFKVTEFLTGFTGESATLVVDDKGAYLWTDGRFFIQADKQLAGSGVEIMKMGEEGVPTPEAFIAALARDKAASEFVLGFDGRVVPSSFRGRLEKAASEENVSIMVRSDEDLAGMVWTDRPSIKAGEIWEFPLSSSGVSSEQKIAAVREAMAKEGADHLLLTDLMETAWLFNLRGSDILYTPVFFSFTLLSQDKICLYVMDESVKDRLDDALKGVEIKAYEQIYDDVAAITEGTVWLDSRSCNYALTKSLGNDIKVIDKQTPVGLMKLIKNDTEIGCTQNAHIKDGVAVTKLIKWLKDTVSNSEHRLTEISVADKLHNFRSEQSGFIEESFETISAYGPNGAIVHYAPTEETNADVKPEGFLLLDSGGQYIDGTTDITRTIAVGPLSREMVECYTYVLKGHIAMATYEAKDAHCGTDVDAAARKPLQDHGMDFNHGLSHGVGHVLGVHEGPRVISKVKSEGELKAGMIMSDEPGVYLEDKFGVRIENLVVWQDSGHGTLVNKPLTCVPYEREAIDKTLLIDDEIRWVDEYHARVRETLSPLLDDETNAYLIEATKPL